MNILRNSNLEKIANCKIKEIQDYLKGYEDFPKNNVLRFVLEDGSFIAIRPSGTEPKYKIYYSLVEKDREKALIKFNAIQNELNTLLN